MEGVMTLAMVCVAILGIASNAAADFRIDLDPAQLPGDAEIVAINGCLSGFNGVPLGCYDAVVTDPGGSPAMYYATWANDAELGFAYFTRLTLDYLCDDVIRSSSLFPEPFQLVYLPGPANPPAAPTLFPGIDPDMHCRSANAKDHPAAFELGQAFPNPFNPGTTIHFALPAAERVKLNVFNITGQKVATLVNGMMVRGSHEVTFDASALGSGVYMYTIEAGNFTATRKMVLVK
jgi:hypothetical protein